MSRFDVELQRLVDERIAALLPPQPGRMGVLVTRDPASADCTIIFDGDAVTTPVKVWSHVEAAPDDRVGLQQFEGDWVIVGAFTA